MARGWQTGSLQPATLLPVVGIAAAIAVVAPAKALPLPVPPAERQASGSLLVERVADYDPPRSARPRTDNRVVVYSEPPRYQVGWPPGRIEATGRQVTDAPLLRRYPRDEDVLYDN